MIRPLLAVMAVLATAGTARAEPPLACDLGFTRDETAALVARGPSPIRVWSEFTSAEQQARALPDDAINCVPRVMFDLLGPLPWRFIPDKGSSNVGMVTLRSLQRASYSDNGRQVTAFVARGQYQLGDAVKDDSYAVGPRVGSAVVRSSDPYRVNPVYRRPYPF